MADAGPIIATAIENNVHAVEVNTRAVEQFSYTARKLIKWMIFLTHYLKLIFRLKKWHYQQIGKREIIFSFF